MTNQNLPSYELITQTITNLNSAGINAELVQNKEEALQKVLSLIPEHSEVMTMTSITLEECGIATAINDSGKFDSVRNKLNAMDRTTQSLEMQKLGAAPEFVVGSVHGVSSDGKVLIVSNTGSQLAAYVYGSAHVVWVVGVQKIAPTIEEAMKRVREVIVPKETVRARKAYGLPDSWNTNISKEVVINKEVNPQRINLIFVNEEVGF